MWVGGAGQQVGLRRVHVGTYVQVRTSRHSSSSGGSSSELSLSASSFAFSLPSSHSHMKLKLSGVRVSRNCSSAYHIGARHQVDVVGNRATPIQRTHHKRILLSIVLGHFLSKHPEVLSIHLGGRFRPPSRTWGPANYASTIPRGSAQSSRARREDSRHDGP